MTSSKSKVEIDERLTDLFFSRKQNGGKDVVLEEEEETVVNAGFSEIPWLQQFAVTAPGSSTPNGLLTHETSFDITTSFVVRKSEVRPFWASDDLKSIAHVWKKSKRLLAQDCQKQRKAALRKSIRR